MPPVTWMDSFDHYDDNELSGKFNASYWNDSLNNQPQIVTGGRKNSCLLLKNGANAYKSIADTASVAVGFAFRPDIIAASRILVLRDEGTYQLYAYLSSTGRVQVYRGNGTLLGTSTITLQASQWYHIELAATISTTAGSFTLRINGSSDLGASDSSINTQNSSNARVNIVQLGNSGNNSVQMRYDDLYITDGNLLGPVAVDVLRPNGGVPGYMDMQVVGGAGSHYQAINDLTPDSDTSYVYSHYNWNGSVLFSEYEDIRESTGGGIFGAAVHTYVRKEYGNTRGFQTGVYPGTWDGASGTVQFYNSTLYVETEYAYHSDVYPTNPGSGGTWTVGSINALKAGFRRII